VVVVVVMVVKAEEFNTERTYIEISTMLFSTLQIPAIFLYDPLIMTSNLVKYLIFTKKGRS